MPNYSPTIDRKAKSLERIYIDANGPWNTPSLHGRYTETVSGIRSLAKYALLYVDDATANKWPSFYSTRGEFRKDFIYFIEKVERESSEGLKVISIRIDNAREFTAGDIQAYCCNKLIE